MEVVDDALEQHLIRDEQGLPLKRSNPCVGEGHGFHLADESTDLDRVADLEGERGDVGPEKHDETDRDQGSGDQEAPDHEPSHAQEVEDRG